MNHIFNFQANCSAISYSPLKASTRSFQSPSNRVNLQQHNYLKESIVECPATSGYLQCHRRGQSNSGEFRRPPVPGGRLHNKAVTRARTLIYATLVAHFSFPNACNGATFFLLFLLFCRCTHMTEDGSSGLLCTQIAPRRGRHLIL